MKARTITGCAFGLVTILLALALVGVWARPRPAAVLVPRAPAIARASSSAIRPFTFVASAGSSHPRQAALIGQAAQSAQVVRSSPTTSGALRDEGLPGSAYVGAFAKLTESERIRVAPWIRNLDAVEASALQSGDSKRLASIELERDRLVHAVQGADIQGVHVDGDGAKHVD